jgi:hypothetical protein
MRFLVSQPVPKTLDLTYFGKYHVKVNTQKESEKHQEVQRQVQETELMTRLQS